MHVYREMATWWPTEHEALQAKELALEETTPTDSLILDFQALKFEDTNFCCLSLLVCGALCGSLSKLKQSLKLAVCLSLTIFPLSVLYSQEKLSALEELTGLD